MRKKNFINAIKQLSWIGLLLLMIQLYIWFCIENHQLAESKKFTTLDQLYSDKNKVYAPWASGG